MEEDALGATKPKPRWENKEATLEISNSKELNLKDNERIADIRKYTSLRSKRVIESANLLTVEKEDEMEMNLDPVDTTLFIFNKTEHTKMPNDDINESDSEKL